MTHVLLYVPNIIGYIRITFAGIAFANIMNPLYFFVCYSISYLLDATDGHFARKLHQTSQFGAMLDMMTDRGCTILLLVNLSHLYPDMRAYFISMALLDIVSHWLQMTSSIISGATSHKGKAHNENWLVSLYYRSQVSLFMIVFWAELFNMLCYLFYFYPQIKAIMWVKVLYIISVLVFHFKQVISVAQLHGSVLRYLKYSEKKMEEDKAIKDKTN